MEPSALTTLQVLQHRVPAAKLDQGGAPPGVQGAGGGTPGPQAGPLGRPLAALALAFVHDFVLRGDSTSSSISHPSLLPVSCCVP